jgi:FtsZ-binding cell division protein ZapB
MMVRDKNIELVIDALVFKIRHLETEVAWQDMKIEELKKENAKLKGEKNGQA